mmetsp:Transcript_19380/g.50360  ORF Transcript_19380/g.50360 Transcript_19380/m.50360 type:complete len:236 (+) Transcript_19380:270-977(+)
MAAVPGDGGILAFEAPEAILRRGSKSGGVKAHTGKKSRGEGRELLDSVIVPRSFEKNGVTYTQRAALTPATHHDVIAAQRKLDVLLKQREARETGLCPIRSELYAQAFDEIIRQCTLVSSARGLLMLRVRNEIRMTIAACQAAYESAIAFGMRTRLKSAVHQRSLAVQKLELTEQIAQLKAELKAVTDKCDQIQKDGAAARADDLAKHTEEVDEMRKVQDARMRDLEDHLAPKKS